MIGSVFEQRDQLLALEKRRQEVAAGNTAAQVPPVAASVAAPLAAGMPGGYSAPAMAVKAAAPDIGKRRKRKGHDLAREEPAVTGPEDAARGRMDAMDDVEARKTYSERGSEEGPGHSMQPGPVEAESFDRPYESPGHAAESPMAGAPRQMPIMHAAQGHVQPIELPGALVAGYVPARVTQAVSLGSPSERVR